MIAIIKEVHEVPWNEGKGPHVSWGWGWENPEEEAKRVRFGAMGRNSEAGGKGILSRGKGVKGDVEAMGSRVQKAVRSPIWLLKGASGGRQEEWRP